MVEMSHLVCIVNCDLELASVYLILHDLILSVFSACSRDVVRKRCCKQSHLSLDPIVGVSRRHTESERRAFAL